MAGVINRAGRTGGQERCSVTSAGRLWPGVVARRSTVASRDHMGSRNDHGAASAVDDDGRKGKSASSCGGGACGTGGGVDGPAAGTTGGMGPTRAKSERRSAGSNCGLPVASDREGSLACRSTFDASRSAMADCKSGTSITRRSSAYPARSAASQITLINRGTPPLRAWIRSVTSRGSSIGAVSAARLRR